MSGSKLKRGTLAKGLAPAPDNSGKKTGKPRPTTFKPGAEWRGNAKGRPKGSRNRLSEDFIADLHDVWRMVGTLTDEEIAELPAGKRALILIAAARPVSFVTVVGNLVPREFDVDLKHDASADFRKYLEAAASGKFRRGKVDKAEDDRL